MKTREKHRAKPRSGAVLGWLCLVACAAAPALSQTPPRYQISTIAGNGANDFAGDDGAAVNAALSLPIGAVADGSGNLYISDQGNARVRRVSADGVIRTVAGDGAKFLLGDGKPAVDASLNGPSGLTLDGAGNLLIADTANHVVRRIDSSGVINTVAGFGFAGFGGDTGSATNANLRFPSGVAVTSDRVIYIADTRNHRIRRVDAEGVITTFAGNGGQSYTGDGGAAASANLNNPRDVALDSAGNVYFSDSDNHRIRKVSPDGVITTVAGNGSPGFSGDGGPATSASLYYPDGIAVDASGNLFIADSLNSRIRWVGENGVITTVAGNGGFGFGGDGGLATDARLFLPSGVALGSNGVVYVVDSQNHRVRRLDPIPEPPPTPPAIDSGGVIRASAFGGLAAAAPGSWVEIYGAALSSTTREWAAADFNGSQAPTSLDGVQVSVGGQPAFLSYVSPGQINAQIPAGVGLGPQQLTVTTAAGTSAPQQIDVAAVAPGLFAPAGFRINGNQYVGALFADGQTYVMPENAVAGLGIASRPAEPGETITLYGVGFGAVTPAIHPGEVAQQENMLTEEVQVLFGETPAELSYAGLTPNYVGLYQFNVVVPNVAPGDAVPLTVSVGGVAVGQALVTSVRLAPPN